MNPTGNSEALFGEAPWWTSAAPLRSVTCTARSQASVLPRVGVHPKSRLTLCLLVLSLSALGWRAYEQWHNRKPTEGRRDFKNLLNWLDNCTSPILCPSNPRGWCGPQAAHRMGLMKAKESWGVGCWRGWELAQRFVYQLWSALTSVGILVLCLRKVT